MSLFTTVMATGIVALALRKAGAGDASWVLAAVAAGTYLVLLGRAPSRPQSRGEALGWFAFVAGVSAASVVFDIFTPLAAAAWLATAAGLLATLGPKPASAPDRPRAP